MEANNGATPSDFTTNVYVLPCVNSISEIIDCSPFSVIVSTAFLAFIKPQPVSPSGPTNPASSAVFRAKPFKVAAFIKLPYFSL